MEQNLKRSHDMVDDQEAKAVMPSEGVHEPERKKVKTSAEYVEETKYWYHIIANLDSGPANYKAIDKLEQGLTDRQKVIENINQLWHVQKARLILESLDLSNPYWREDWFELSSNQGELPTKDDNSDDLKLKGKVTPEILGLNGEISKDLLKEYINKREDIESHGLLLMEKLFKKCLVQPVEEITEMMDKCGEIYEPYNVEIIYKQIMDTDLPYELASKKAILEKWKKYILPQIVKTQNELNMVDEPVVLEKNEEFNSVNKFILGDDSEDSKAFLLEQINFAEEKKIKETKEDEMEEEEYEDEIDEYIPEVFFCTYLFDLELPDEKQKVGSNFLGFLHCDPNDSNENVYLKILESVMQMYVSGDSPQEHQTLEVSELRLAVSLMILDCLNKELTYLILSQIKESAFMLYRPLVRLILDQFIVDYCHPTKYEKYMFLQCGNPDIQPMVNILFQEDDMIELEGITWDVVQTQRGSYFVDEEKDNTSKEENQVEKHPICDSTIDGLKDKYLTHQTEASSKISRKDLDDSMYITYYTDSSTAVTEPLTDQNLVSFFRYNYLDNSCDEPFTYDESADNFIENRSIDCYYKGDKSLHMDLIRVLRRAGVKSYDEGSLLEAYISLKNYISLSLQNLEAISEDGLVEVEHIEKVAKMFAVKNGLKGKEHVRLDNPFYYKLDYNQETPAAKDLDAVRDLEERNTEIVELDGPVNTNSQPEIIEGLGKDLYNSLRDDQYSTLCDSFIQTEDGIKVGVFTSIIKDRLPELYNEFFDSEEKRKNGLCLSSIHFEMQEGEKLVFDETVITKWLTCIYIGILESEDESLTIQKLLAKWSPRKEEVISLDKPTQISETNVIYVDEDSIEETTSEEDSDEESQSYQVESGSESEEDENDEDEEEVKAGEEEEEKVIESEPLSRLFLDEEGKDFSLVANGHRCKVHKFILCIRSSYFKVLLLGNFSDKNISEYDVSDFLKSSEALELFVYYLYHDTLENENFTQEYYVFQNLIDLQEFSQFVLSDGLKSECLASLLNHSTLDQITALLNTSLEANKEELFDIAHTLLLKTPYPFFNGNIIDEETTKYYQIMCTSLTLENAFVKLDYLNSAEQSTTLHPFILNQIKSQIENIHWFIANRASSLDNKFIRTLPQAIQDLISRFFTHDNLGMASFEMIQPEEDDV